MKCAILMLTAGFLILPSVARALDVCCECTPPVDNQEDVCLTIDKTRLEQADDCRTLPQNIGLPDDWTCAKKDPLSEAQCKTIAEGGICKSPPVSAQAKLGAPTPPTEADQKSGVSSEDAANAEASSRAREPIIPVLGIPISTISFSGSTGGDLLARYIAGALRFGISIASVAATIAFIYGAFLYVTGSALGTIETGKRVMIDAVVGMLIVISSVFILRVLNPETTKFKPLEIISINPRNAFSDSERERTRTLSYATAQGPRIAPVYDADTGELIQPPATTKRQTIEGVVVDAGGNPVAQNQCPPDMVPILKSDEYKRANVDSFCIDRYEAPNQEGQLPIIGILDWEADWYCDLIGKRLCSVNEWRRACLGPQGKNTFGYGPKFIPGRIVSKKIQNSTAIKTTGNPRAPCNYDSNARGFVNAATDARIRMTFPAPNHRVHSILNPSNPAFSDPTLRYIHFDFEGGKRVNKGEINYQQAFEIMRAEVARLTEGGLEPSGSRPDCVTDEGVHDMVGNTQEVTVKDRFSNLNADTRFDIGDERGANKPYAWVGWNFAPISHIGSSQADPSCLQGAGGGHNVAWRPWENGFRCCMALDVDPSASPIAQ